MSPVPVAMDRRTDRPVVVLRSSDNDLSALPFDLLRRVAGCPSTSATSSPPEYPVSRHWTGRTWMHCTRYRRILRQGAGTTPQELPSAHGSPRADQAACRSSAGACGGTTAATHSARPDERLIQLLHQKQASKIGHQHPCSRQGSVLRFFPGALAHILDRQACSEPSAVKKVTMAMG